MNGESEDMNDVQELISLLEREIAAIEAGDLDQLPDLLPLKQDIADRLEEGASGLEDLLARGDARSEDMRNRLLHLKELVNRDARIVARVAASLRDIVDEVFQTQQGGNLRGLYDAKGRTQDAARARVKTFDLSL